MTESTLQTHSTHHGKHWYDRSYKLLLIPPAILFIFAIVYLGFFYHAHGDLFNTDVSITGGTTITVFAQIPVEQVEQALSGQFPDIVVRGISDLRTGEQHGFFVESVAPVEELKPAVEELVGFTLTNDNSSIEFSGSAVSQQFYAQLRNALFAAFILMAWVVFLIFSTSARAKSWTTVLTFLGLSILLPGISVIKAVAGIAVLAGLIIGLWAPGKKKYDYFVLLGLFLVSIAIFIYSPIWIALPIGVALITIYAFYSVPSVAVILAAFADIVMTIAVIDLLGIQLALSGIVALLMLVGYSVDTDILLTSRVLKKDRGTVNEQIYGAFKTGMLMTLTAIASVTVSLLLTYSISEILSQIFTILLIGLVFDIINTWLTNASLIKWYAEVKKLA